MSQFANTSRTRALVALLVLSAAAVTFLGYRFHRWKSGGRIGDFRIGGSVLACSTGFTRYDKATWSGVPAVAAARGSTWRGFGIRNGNALGVTIESPKADWHWVFFIPLPN